MSAGRSIATDLPMPSGMKREVASLAATLMTGTWASAPVAGAIGARLVPSNSAASAAVRISVLVARVVLAMSLSPLARSSRHRCRADAEADDVHTAGAAVILVVGLR